MHRGIDLFLSVMVVLAASPCFAKGKLLLHVVDAAEKKPLPFRLHLRTEKGIAVQVPKLPFWIDHVSVPGGVQLELTRGNYFFEIEHGPEFVNGTGYFTINDGADDEKTVELKRAADMAAESWVSADFDVRRALRDVELAMLADDLRFVPLTTWNNRKSEWAKTPLPRSAVTPFDVHRLYDLAAGADDRPGGPIHLFRLPQPAALPATGATQLVSLLPKLRELKSAQPDLWIDVGHPSAWDLPLLVANGLADSYCVLPSQLLRDKVDPAPLGRPFDRGQFAGLAGLGNYACDVYFQLLNCGLRLPPSAGSGSGVVANPVGYNRLYVWTDPATLTADTFWRGLKEGRATVTNGPLIRPRADGRLPGFVFDAPAGEKVLLHIAMDLTFRDKVDYVEVIQNGKVVHNLPLRDWAKDGGKFPSLVFHESGWACVRVRCDHPKTCRFAVSAPWYVEIGDKPRTSRSAAQYFLDWLEDRAATLKIADAAEKQIADAELETARAFWRKKVDEATSP